MGLKATDPDDDKGAMAETEAGGASSVSCSICLEVVADGGDRSTAKLRCGHQFHLDCIGSAFNAKGVMQCPNCRKIEKGTWLYSNNYRYPGYNMDDWPDDEDLYGYNYTETPYGIHWCPFSRLARFPSSFEEGDSSPSIPYHDLSGHPALFEHQVNSSSNHSCPYLAYLHPFHSASSSGSQVPIDNAMDGANFHHPWNNPSGSTDVPSSYTFSASDLHYPRWDLHSPFYATSSLGNNLEQESAPSIAIRSARLESDARPRNVMHAFIVGHGSASRASSSAVSSLRPPYIANSQGRARIYEPPRASYQHHNTTRLHSSSRRSGGTRGISPIGPTSAASEPAGVFLLAPPAAAAAAASRSPLDVEINGGNHLYAWERDSLAPFPLLPVDRDLAWWDPPQASGSTDSNNRAAFRQRHSSERSSSQSRSPHVPRMHPFI